MKFLMWLSHPLRLWRFRREWGYLDEALSLALPEVDHADQQFLEDFCWSPGHQQGWLCRDCQPKSLGHNMTARIDGAGHLVIEQREGEHTCVVDLPADAARSLANFLRGPKIRSAIGARQLNRKGLAS